MIIPIRSVSLFLLLAGASAFMSPVLPKHAMHKCSTTLPAANSEEVSIQQTIRAFGVAAALLVFNSMESPVNAAVPVPPTQIEESYFSSSIQVSETIKTMDFSLPSSYDSIADAKASSDELVTEENILTGTKVKKAPKPKSSSGDGFSLGGQQLTEEQKAELAAQKRAEREMAAEEKKALEAEKKAEKEAIAAAKKAEKEAKDAERAAEQAIANKEKAEKAKAAKEAKAAAEAAKEAKAATKQFSGAEFVDMGLPSYDSATSSKEKSPFKL